MNRPGFSVSFAHFPLVGAALVSIVAATSCSDAGDDTAGQGSTVDGTGSPTLAPSPNESGGGPTMPGNTTGAGPNPVTPPTNPVAPDPTGNGPGLDPIPPGSGGTGNPVVPGPMGMAGEGQGGPNAPVGNGGAGPTGNGGMPEGAGGVPEGTAGMPDTGVGGGFVGGGDGGAPARDPLDCGENAVALEDHGPPSNRLNYVIVGDGYSESDLQPGGTMDQHLEATMEKRFSDPIGQPYLRYRKFVNICVLRVPSGPICGSSEFGCCGDDGSRLANCDNGSVNDAINANISPDIEIDWRAVVLNGSSWWNSGGTLMLWSGGNQDGPGAALHEGGHGHHFISDEYGNCEQGRVSREMTYGVNVSLSSSETNGRWDDWLGYDQNPGTGEQTLIACDGGQTWRPSQNSMMNSLFGNDPDTSYNAVSREKMALDIWRVVESPWDWVSPEAGAVTNPTTLTVGVIDSEVISVDWSLDGNLIAEDGGPSYNVEAADLAPGEYTVTARAYDNAGDDLVRQVPGTTFNRQYWGSGDMGHSDKTVTWTVTIQ